MSLPGQPQSEILQGNAASALLEVKKRDAEARAGAFPSFARASDFLGDPGFGLDATIKLEPERPLDTLRPSALHDPGFGLDATIKLEPEGPLDTLRPSVPNSLLCPPSMAFDSSLKYTCSTIALNGNATLSSPAAVRGNERKWVRGGKIGWGSMGVVFQAMDQASGQVIAVKEVPIDTKKHDDMKFKEQLENELRILKDLSHPCIVTYLGNDYIDECLYIYMEHMHGGSMSQMLREFGAFEESLMMPYAKDMLRGLEYLHTRDPPVLHRDVKSANVLMVGLDARVKLSDFGCSKRTAEETMCHTIKGSIPWMAPEVIINTGYGRRADIWSFGCVLIEMATAKSPWGGFDNPLAAMRKIGMSEESPPIPGGLSQVCVEFITRCTCRDKNSRPSATELLDHEWIRDLLTED